jgi:hypothetical protein
MDQDYIRSRYGGGGQGETPPPQQPSTGGPVPPAPEPAGGGIVEGFESHLPHFEFGGEGTEPWYEARWAIAVFAVALGPVIGIFVWWVLTRYDLEQRVKMTAVGLSLLLILIVSLLL